MATDIGSVGATFVDGNAHWRSDVADYIDKKKNLQFVQPPYKKVTHEFMKAQDVIYNPITQKYTNPIHETKVAEFEKQNFIDVLAKNKVSQLDN
jgi:hypothetical protein